MLPVARGGRGLAILFHTRESARVPPGRKSIVCSLRPEPGAGTTEGGGGGGGERGLDKLKWSGASALGDKQNGLSPGSVLQLVFQPDKEPRDFHLKIDTQRFVLSSS